MRYDLKLPLQQEDIDKLRAGDIVRISGPMYTARDAAHKRMIAMLQKGEDLPVPMQGACIYYAGPCPAAPGEVIGPCGPTTSGRVDAFTPQLIEKGLSAMVGKGLRSEAVVQAMRGKAVYFSATGGAAYLIAQCVKEQKVVAFDDLGTEAIRLLQVENMPLIVAIDSHGGSLYAK